MTSVTSRGWTFDVEDVSKATFFEAVKELTDKITTKLKIKAIPRSSNLSYSLENLHYSHFCYIGLFSDNL